MKTQKIPNGALRLVQLEEHCHAFAVGEEGKKQLKMTIYSGGVIKGHWWWGNLAVDLEGMKFSKAKYPVLENHNTDRRIAFTGKPIIGEGGLKLDPEKTTFMDNEESAKFQKESADGFPFQASMYAVPSSVERVQEGESAKVNGFTMKGPASIWRKCDFQEASVCVFGWDKQTESKAFSKSETTEIEYEEKGGDKEEEETDETKLAKEKEVNNDMKIETLADLKKAYPDFVQKLSEELQAAFDVTKEELEATITQLTADNKEKDERVLKLEKKDIVRTEKELKSDAKSIVNSKLAESDIPERIHQKIRSLVDHNKFVKDDVLDREAFEKAIDEEIKFFEEAGVKDSVIGLGSSTRTDEDPAKLAVEQEDKDDDEAVDAMVKMAEGDQNKD